MLEREEIYQRVWGYAMARGDRSVDVFVRKLRQKLEKASPEWRYIHTHFGVGYRFAPEPAGARATRPSRSCARAPRRGRRGDGRDAAVARSSTSSERRPHVAIVLALAAARRVPARAAARRRRLVGARPVDADPRRRSCCSPRASTASTASTSTALGDAGAALLYGASASVVLAMAAAPRAVDTGAGTSSWIVLVGGVGYALLHVSGATRASTA